MIKIYAERSRHAQFIWNVRLPLTIFKHKLPKPRTVVYGDRKFHSTKMMKEELLSLVGLHRIPIRGRRYSDDMASGLSAQLVERQVLIFHELSHT